MPSTDCKIFILTGEVHCGKSRALGRFISDRKSEGRSICGLLNPSIDKEKWFMNVGTEDVFSAEKMTDSDIPIKIGHYNFSTNAFEKAKKILSKKANKPCDFFVIDELGKLEMEGGGLEPAISDILKNLHRTKIRNLIIVIRDFLVEDAKAKFNIEPERVLDQTELLGNEWN